MDSFLAAHLIPWNLCVCVSSMRFLIFSSSPSTSFLSCGVQNSCSHGWSWTQRTRKESETWTLSPYDSLWLWISNGFEVYYINLTARDLIDLSSWVTGSCVFDLGMHIAHGCLGIIWCLSNPVSYLIRSGCDGDDLVVPISRVSRLHLSAPTCYKTLRPPTHTPNTTTTTSSIMTSNISGFGMAGYLWVCEAGPV